MSLKNLPKIEILTFAIRSQLVDFLSIYQIPNSDLTVLTCCDETFSVDFHTTNFPLMFKFEEFQLLLHIEDLHHTLGRNCRQVSLYTYT